MKKILKSNNRLTLGDLVTAVTSVSRNLNEAAAAVADLIESARTPFGTTAYVGHAARLSETPARWDRPAVPLGTHEPAWPA